MTIFFFFFAKEYNKLIVVKVMYDLVVYAEKLYFFYYKAWYVYMGHWNQKFIYPAKVGI